MAEIILSGSRALGIGAATLVDEDIAESLGHLKWHMSAAGYVCRGVSRGPGLPRGKEYLARTIMQCPPGMVVDHISGNKLDNRRSNLRICTVAENVRNRTQVCKRIYKSARFKGVNWAKAVGKWHASIRRPHGSTFYLGSFEDDVEAAVAYNMAALEFFGEFASFNRNLLLEV